MKNFQASIFRVTILRKILFLKIFSLVTFVLPVYAENTTGQSVAVLEGFKPGSRIEYKVIPDGVEGFSGEGLIGPDGTLSIMAPSEQSFNTDGLTYDVTIESSSSSNPVKVLLTFNRNAGTVSLLGEGFDEFSDLRTMRGDKTEFTRADWTGRYRENTSFNPGMNRDNPFVFAFFDGNISSDMPSNPSMIRVLTAPGGGTLTPSGTNGYSNNVSNVCSPAGVPNIPSYCVPQNTPAHTFGTYSATSPHMRRVSFNIMDNYVRALMMMTEQLSTVMMMHMQGIGKLIDAKQQLETQRLEQQLQAQAHKDYHPSTTMCQVGSFVKSLPRAEEVQSFNKQALNNILMEGYANQKNRSGSAIGGYALDIEARIRQFRWVYCDPRDNNDGLAFLCEHDQDQNLSNSTQGAAPVLPLPPIGGTYAGGGLGAQTPNIASNERKNKDIDFSRVLGNPLTLKTDFTDAVITNDEEDILALARNIYWPSAFNSANSQGLSERSSEYMESRRLFAMHNVAHNSFVNLAAMKSETDMGLGSASGWNFMKSLMRDFGLSDPEIHKMLGDYPSYYAQMEVLTKKMYQNPDFFTNLYDKPVNVERIGAALDAIEIMQQRDMQLSRQRSEMLTSVMVETELRPQIQKVNDQLAKEIGKTR